MEVHLMSQPSSSKGWIVTIAGTGINLALGVLYSWSVISKALQKDWLWSASKASIPYSVACGMFAIIMVFAGRAQDKIGPRKVASLGGICAGAGLIISSLASPGSIIPMVIGFGLLIGAGMGLGYASATPPAVKWFPPYKKGLITGLVVSGFGLAAVYISPLTNSLLKTAGINNTFMILGIAFLIGIVLLAQLLQDPPPGYVPAGMPAVGSPNHQAAKYEYDWDEMMKTPQFYLLWVMFACGSFAGLMIIGHMARIAMKQLPSVNLGFILVALLAIGNAGGRILAGVASDKLGRTRTMLLVFIGQAIVMFFFNQFTTTLSLILGSILVGAFYGSNLSLFPSTTADYYGTKNLGVNYGLVFTAWGVGGVFGGMVAGQIFDATGSYNGAFMVALVICLIAAALTFVTKAPKERLA
jgi:OFA family oxalate/formate antiporter-like MFS transporter